MFCIEIPLISSYDIASKKPNQINSHTLGKSDGSEIFLYSRYKRKEVVKLQASQYKLIEVLLSIVHIFHFLNFTLDDEFS